MGADPRTGHRPTLVLRHRLYFLRHGETDWNLAHRLQGDTDIGLNDTGRRQARRHAQVMANLGEDWAGFDFAVSPMLRTRETFEIMRGELGIDVEPRLDTRLREGSFGRWEGWTWAEVIEREPDNHAIWIAECWDRAPHGGETYGSVAERVREWAKDMARPTVVVSHGGVSRALRAIYQGLERRNLASLKVSQKRFMRLDGGAVDLL